MINFKNEFFDAYLNNQQVHIKSPLLKLGDFNLDYQLMRLGEGEVPLLENSKN